MVKKIPFYNVDAGLLVLRIGVGMIFLATGGMKVLDLTMTVGFFAQMGFGAFWAYLVTFVELLCGLTVLLGIGVYTRIAAKLLAIVMIVAIWVLHKDMTMALAPISIFFSTACILLSGPGKYSLVRE